MGRHDLRGHFVLLRKLCLQGRDLFLKLSGLSITLPLKGRCPGLRKRLLPAMEHRMMQHVLVAEVLRDRGLLDEMPMKNPGFLLP